MFGCRKVRSFLIIFGETEPEGEGDLSGSLSTDLSAVVSAEVKT